MGNPQKNEGKERVFSGIQPSGDMHLGNYLGAVKNWVNMASQYDCIYCVVDLHAITVYQDPRTLQKKSREAAALIMAAGIDPEISTVFIQSHIHAHAELTWLLDCLTPIGWMQRMTQFKEKSEKQKENVSIGLFGYPVLMAADILLYDTNLVPVGEDQKQHLEFTRDLAQRFNSKYGETFVIPEPSIPTVGARIMGLENPEKKMSKSEGGEGNTIYLLDPPDKIRKKIKRATTDSLRDILFDENRPGIYNLLILYELFTGDEREVIEARFEGKGYGDFKDELAEVVVEGLRPLQSRYGELTEDPTYIDTLLSQGADRIRPVAERVLTKAKKRMGVG
jgi:tryptophanyl-tRNA synthetase